MLSKGFSETNPSATAEWRPSVRTALSTIRLTRKRVGRVKTVRKELIHSLPLCGIPVEAIDIDDDVLASLHFKLLGQQRILLEGTKYS